MEVRERGRVRKGECSCMVARTKEAHIASSKHEEEEGVVAFSNSVATSGCFADRTVADVSCSLYPIESDQIK